MHAVVVIPAHNERRRLPVCLRSALTAATLAPMPVVIVVVLDATDDGSEDLVGQYGADVHFVTVEAHNVGAARAAGFRYARSLPGHTGMSWYATTDADSSVDPDWLTRQLEHDTDMVLGVVRVADWRDHRADVVRRYLRKYADRVRRGRPHIHGANMGFSSQAYWAVGGFRGMPSGEDADLVKRFDAAGYRVRSDPALSVSTSARVAARAPRGFAHHLRELAGSAEGSRA